MNFKKRIFELEIMDQEELSAKDLKSAYKDINRSNYLLGGYRATYNSILQLCNSDQNKSIDLIDVGCGEGGMLRYLADQFRKKGYHLRFYGLDLSQQAIDLAIEQSSEYPEIEYYQADILNKDLPINKCEFVTSTLTMHHFNDENIVNFVGRCADLAEKAVVINDLQRSKLAYYLFKIFSAIFIRSPIAKSDGLMSIRKGFSKYELVHFSNSLVEFMHQIQWKWAFRYVWVLKRRRQRIK